MCFIESLVHSVKILIIFVAEKAFDLMIEESKVWKVILGRQLSAFYKIKLDEMVTFITDQDKILCRTIKDLDDVRLAMNCLQTIRENFFRIDMALMLMEDTYALFSEFKIVVPPADIERVDSLRFNFMNMMQKVRNLLGIHKDIIFLISRYHSRRVKTYNMIS